MALEDDLITFKAVLAPLGDSTNFSILKEQHASPNIEMDDSELVVQHVQKQ